MMGILSKLCPGTIKVEAMSRYYQGNVVLELAETMGIREAFR